MKLVLIDNDEVKIDSWNVDSIEDLEELAYTISKEIGHLRMKRVMKQR
ncbi:hypothetical protein LCGC14_2216870 [marine sediment metagenome]|uniref:Uncharacterized protein n=1 Tax=marine sediment metagenome TaxID=412755 RepID=A0A0F9DC55_9ZZZZ